MPSENKMKASDKVLIDLHSVFHGGGPEETEASVCAHCWPSLNSTPAWQVSGINLKDRSGVYNMHFLLFILNDSVEGTVFAQTSSNFAMRKEASNTSPTAELLQVLYSLAKMKKSENRVELKPLLTQILLPMQGQCQRADHSQSHSFQRKVLLSVPAQRSSPACSQLWECHLQEDKSEIITFY